MEEKLKAANAEDAIKSEKTKAERKQAAAAITSKKDDVYGADRKKGAKVTEVTEVTIIKSTRREHLEPISLLS